jgi:CBS domain-containing protein/sporulation protein YlmC with PRC-barrel domain
MAEEIVYLSELLGLKVFDLKGRRIGTLRDAALVPLIDPVRVDRFLVGAGPGWLSVRYDQVSEISPAGIRLKDERLTPYHSDEYMLRLKRDLLDQQIIDSQGRKVVRVNDVTLTKQYESGHEVLHVLEVDIGLRAIVRRVLQGIVSPATIRKLQSRIPANSIRWEFCNILEPDPQRRVRLNISNQFLEKMHPADLADIVEKLGYEDRSAVVSALDDEAAAEMLTEVDPEVKRRIIESLAAEKAADILEEMEPSKAADVLQDLEEERSEQILHEMEPDEKEDVEEALDFPENTAGNLMSSNYLALPEDATVGDALSELRNHEDRLENLHSLYLVDGKEHLKYSVPLARLFFASGEAKLRDFAADPLLFVHSGEKLDKIAELFDRYNLLSLPVVDEDERLIGAILVDDIVALLRHS